MKPEPPPSPLRRLARSRGLRAAAPFLLFLTIAVTAARLDLQPDLGHVHVAILSGSEQGNYHAVVDRLAQAAARQRGHIDNLASAGSAENLERLARSCDAGFALVQAGVPAPASAKLQLLGRLPRAESVFFLGKDADKISEFSALRGLKIDIGPDGSGTARLARALFESRDFRGLDPVLSNHAVPDALELSAKGDVDLAVFVMDEDAAFIESAVRDRGLQIAGFPHIDAIARRFPYLRHGRIGAGQYDSIRMLPVADKQVLRIETLVVANHCARRSQTIGVLTALAEVFPDFARHNRETPNNSGLELAPVARDYLEHQGPELLDEYFPRLGDVMPPGNWVHVVMGVSILFNVMGLGNRFRLWRIDAARVKAEQDIARSFGPGTTLGDIARAQPEGAMLGDALGVEIDRVILELEQLAAVSRRQSLSMLVPMGGEMAYRYQEQLIHEALAVLRAFRARRDEALASG